MIIRLFLTAIAICFFGLSSCSRPKNPTQSQDKTKDNNTKSESSQASKSLAVVEKTTAVESTSVTSNESSTKEKKEFSELLIGTWRLIKMDTSNVPGNACIIFTADNKFVTDANDDRARPRTRTGNYSLNGKTITFTEIDKDNTERKWDIIIEKLSENELTTRAGSPPGQLSIMEKVDKKQ